MSSGRPPYPFAILLCDDVARSPDGKNTLIGVFDTVFAVQFPAVHPKLTFWAKLADGGGTYHVRIQYVDVSENKVLMNIDGNEPLRWAESEAMSEITFQIGGLPIAHEGRYEFRLFLNDMFVGHVTLYAKHPVGKRS